MTNKITTALLLGTLFGACQLDEDGLGQPPLECPGGQYEDTATGELCEVVATYSDGGECTEEVLLSCADGAYTIEAYLDSEQIRFVFIGE
jgi:hypothetical protein